mmetsp:Transcript_14105/g.21303  ORF Transcript_14105/g.21303 Transcript_14105/m.21303 type:complete len:361 (-) Transcript_14105:142-1224(-)
MMIKQVLTRAVIRSNRRWFSSDVPSVMKAAMVRETGTADQLKVETNVAVPEIADGQVLVKNEFAGINFIDTYHRSGLYKRELPFIGGQEGGGVVVKTTPKAESAGVNIGDRVAYSVFGSYAEYTAVPAAKILPVPTSVPLDVATACVVQGMTAHYLTSDCNAGLIKPGEWCLIHGVGGGTCQWAAQMARLRGYKVIGTCSAGKESVAKDKVDELIVLDEVPGTSYEDYSSKDVVQQVMRITNNVGVKCVIDGIGLATFDISLNSLARRGIFISFGNASGAAPEFAPLKLIAKSAFLTRPKLLDYTVDRVELLYRANEIMGWLQSGDLAVSVDTTFPLDQAPEGHKYLEAGKSKGKVLYKI